MKLLYSIIILHFFMSSCSPKITEATMPSDEVQIVNENEHAFRKNAPEPGPAPKINISEAKTYVLDNGLKVILVENHKIPQVSFQLRLINDPIREADKVGMVGTTADVLSRGTNNRTKAEIDEAIDFIGGNLFSSSNGLFASSLTKHQDVLLELMTDILYNPSFPEEELVKLKTQSLSALESSKNDPNYIANNIKAKVIYGDAHPYGEIQNPHHVEAITIQDLKNIYNSYYVPTNAYLIVLGDISEKGVRAVTNKYFNSWKGTTVKPARKRTVAMSEKRQVRFSHKEGAVQSVIILSNPTDIKPGDQDAIPASLLNSLLGGGISSRLNQNLREDKAYTYGAGSSLRPDALTGTFDVQTSVRNDVTDSTLVEILYELEKIRTVPVSEKELQSMKNFMTGGFARALESPQTIARFAYNIARYNLPSDYYQNYLERLNAVTQEDILTMAKKYIHPERLDVIVVGNKDEVVDKLKVFDADGTVDFFDPFGKKLELNEIPIPENVTANLVIEDYLNAIGGKRKLSGLNSIYTKMTTNAMGQDLVIESFQEGDEKYAMKLGNGQMVFQEQKFDGENAAIIAMGQTNIVTEGPQFEEMKNGTRIIPQLSYETDGTQLELKGIEPIGEENAYKIVVTSNSGIKSSEFYSVATGLLLRSSKTQDGPQGPVTIQTDLSNYYDIGNGILFPEITSITGMLPGGAVMQMQAVEIKANEIFEEGTFRIE